MSILWVQQKRYDMEEVKCKPCNPEFNLVMLLFTYIVFYYHTYTHTHTHTHTQAVYLKGLSEISDSIAKSISNTHIVNVIPF